MSSPSRTSLKRRSPVGSWVGGRHRGTGWLRGRGLPRRVQWELDAIRLQLRVRARALFWLEPQSHRIVEGEGGPHPTGDGAVGLALDGQSFRITGPEVHALGRSLAHGCERLVLDHVVRPMGMFPVAGTLVVSAEGVEFVSRGRIARAFGWGDCTLALADLVEVRLDAGKLQFLSRDGRCLELRSRGDRRLRHALGQLLASCEHELTPELGRDGWVTWDGLETVIGRLKLPPVPGAGAGANAFADLHFEETDVLIPVVVHTVDGQLRPGRLLLRESDAVFIPRRGSLRSLPYCELTLGASDDGNRMVLFRGGKPITVYLHSKKIAWPVSSMLSARLAWHRPDEPVDLEALLDGVERVELEADGLEVVAIPIEHLIRDETGDGFFVDVEAGWSIGVGTRLRVHCLTADTIRGCRGLIAAAEEPNGETRRLRLRPVGGVHSADRVRREDHRVPIDSGATVYLLSALDTEGHRRSVARASCQVVDISASGMGLRMRSRVEPGFKLRVEVCLDDERLSFDGRVVYAIPDELGSRVGISFLTRGEGQRQELASMLVELERSRAQAELESETGAGGDGHVVGPLIPALNGLAEEYVG